MTAVRLPIDSWVRATAAQSRRGDDAYRMQPLTLRFPPLTERAFEAEHFRGLAAHHRRVALFSIPGTAVVCQVLRGALPEQGLAVTSGQAVVTAGIVVAAIFASAPQLRRWLRAYMVVVTNLFAVTFAVIGFTLPVPFQPLFFLGSLILVLVSLFLLRMGFAHAALATAGQVTVVLLCSRLLGSMLWEVWVVATGFLLLAYVHALLAGYVLERRARETYVAQRLLTAERERSEHLLLNVLPAPIAERLKEHEGTIADSFPEATVLFADVVHFTELSARLTPEALVQRLDRVFGAFDALTEKHGLEKIKTIGDAYMVVAGLPSPRPDHVEAAAALGLDMLGALGALDTVGVGTGDSGDPGDPGGSGSGDGTRALSAPHALQVRIGVHTGPVVAGVIGTKKFAYDLWGDTVNTASRMESHGVPSRIHCTAAVYERLRHRYAFEDRGVIDVKGKGPMHTYLLTAPLPDAPPSSS